MLQQFREHISTHLSFLNGKKLLIALSGGVDSIVLAHLLHTLNFNIEPAHCNFKLRGAESDEDEAFVTGFSSALNVKIHVRHFDTQAYSENHKVSIQMAARTLRYQWFTSLAEALKCHYILTAHHADDALETFLINFSRGTGLEGLTGIPEQNGNVIRPLLPFSKETILDYAEKNNLEWREDSSNAETKYLRNKIRHEITPQLKTLHPTFQENVQKTLRHLQGSSQLIATHIESYKKTLFQHHDNGYRIEVTELMGLHPQKPYLYELFKDFGFTEWDDVARILHASSGKQLFSATHRLVKDRDAIYIAPLLQEATVRVIIDEHTKSITTPVALNIDEVNKIRETGMHTIYVDKEKLKFPLTVRKWEKGDYFYPFGMQGKKKVSKFFKDEKYTLPDKENQWLLCTDDAIVWIIGRRADNRYKVENTTKNILKIKVEQ